MTWSFVRNLGNKKMWLRKKRERVHSTCYSQPAVVVFSLFKVVWIRFLHFQTFSRIFLSFVYPVYSVMLTRLYIISNLIGKWIHLTESEWMRPTTSLEKSRRIPSAFWDLWRKLIFPFSHEAFEKVGSFFGPNATTHEINSSERANFSLSDGAKQNSVESIIWGMIF